MPVYKGDKYLSEAVDSILNQTFSDFEFIIICDDPTEVTRDILDKYQQKDSRMKVYYQERQGLVNSLNRGISLAEGEYIARMDADDVSLLDRLKKQVDFMDNNPEIGIAGTWIKIIGASNYVLKFPCNHDAIKCKMLFDSVMAHPTVMFRKSAFSKNGLSYCLTETYAEDYGLWVRAINVLKFANLPEVLFHYRMHSSTSNTDIQKEISNKLRLSQIRQLGINPVKSEFEIHKALSYYNIESNEDTLTDARLWLEKLQSYNSRTKIYPDPPFSEILAHYWYFACSKSKSTGLDSWRLFHKSRLSRFSNLSYFHKMVLLLRPSLTYFLNIAK